MSRPDFLALLPLLVLAGTAVLAMLAAAFRRSHALAASLSAAGLAAALLAVVPAAGAAPRQVTPLLLVYGHALFFTASILAAGLAVTLLAHPYLAAREDRPEEFYVLLLLATLGAAVLAASDHFASLFLGLEVLSVSLYALIAYRRSSRPGIEAGVKYLVLAATSAAFLIFGLALVYAETGALDFAGVARFRAANPGAGLLLPAGLAMTMVGLGFKLALVPFHMWAPDVYRGAPAPVAAFVATASKGAVFALLVRCFGPSGTGAGGPPMALFAALAVASIFAGNLLALLQDDVKRLLAYSSIAHMGYLLVAFLAGGPLATTAVGFYLATYFAATLGAFGVVTVLSGGGREADRLSDYRGLARRHPWLAGVLSLMLLSLAGLPPTAGFIAKFYVLAAGAAAGLWLLVGVVAAGSVLGLCFYLRLVIELWRAAPDEARVEAACSVPSRLVLAALTLPVIVLGIWPAPFIRLIQAALG